MPRLHAGLAAKRNCSSGSMRGSTRCSPSGLLDEVRAFVSRPRPPGRTAAQAVGYREVIEHLQRRPQPSRHDRAREASDPPIRQAPTDLVPQLERMPKRANRGDRSSHGKLPCELRISDRSRELLAAADHLSQQPLNQSRSQPARSRPAPARPGSSNPVPGRTRLRSPGASTSASDNCRAWSVRPARW